MSFVERDYENGPSEEKIKRRGTDRIRSGSGNGWNIFEKMGAPVNRLTNKIGSEAFWPQSLDKESSKAARILKSFCHDGFYDSKIQPPTHDGPRQNPKVLVKIPRSVIQDCVGLAIFSTMRAGLHVSGAIGSGVLVARLPDGSWSPPSGILVQALGVGFNMGIDMYDCVVVINNYSALQAFTKLRVTLGAQVSAAVGPLGVGGSLDANVNPRKTDPRGVAVDRSPCYTYMKSRGLYVGVQIDGTFVTARDDENTRFYGERLPVSDILAGRLQNHAPASVLPLMEVAKAAEGRWDFNPEVPDEVSNRTAPEDGVADKATEASEKEGEAFQQFDEGSRRSAKEREAYEHDIPHEATQ